MQFLRAIAGADRHVAKFLEQRKRRIDDARARAVGAADLILDGLDDLVPVPRLLGYEVKDEEAKVAMSEETPKAGSATTAVPIVTERRVIAGVLMTGETPAVFVVGMSMVHLFSECISI
jgi:hypothetical protein